MNLLIIKNDLIALKNGKNKNKNFRKIYNFKYYIWSKISTIECASQLFTNSKIDDQPMKNILKKV